MRHTVRGLVTSAVVLASALALVGGAPGVSAQSAPSRPSALAATRAGQLFALERNGSVVELDAATGRGKKRWYTPAAGYVGMDLAASINRAGSLLVVALLMRDDGRGSWSVTVRPDGSTTWNLLSPYGVFTGVAIDLPNASVYLSNATTKEVFRTTLGKEASERFVTGLASASRLGPLAYDEASRRLVIGDSIAGDVYALDTTTNRVIGRTHCGSGEIRALGWDTVRRVVYAVDAGSERVWTIPAESGRLGACRTSFTTGDFREPSGIAILPTHQLWISDGRAKKLFLFASPGSSPAVVADWERDVRAALTSKR